MRGRNVLHTLISVGVGYVWLTVAEYTAVSYFDLPMFSTTDWSVNDVCFWVFVITTFSTFALLKFATANRN